MAECPSIVGVKNILISFKDCDNDQEWRNVTHRLAGDTLPTANTCPYTYTALPGGKVQKSQGTGFTLDMEIERVENIPLAMYQGCAGIDVTIEWENGAVWTFIRGAVIDAGGSDGHTVTVSAVFQEFDELLVAGTMEADTPVDAAA